MSQFTQQRTELQNFKRAIADANRQAAEGDVAAGQELLLAGLQRTQELAANGAWAAGVADCYRAALGHYAARHFPGSPLAAQLSLRSRQVAPARPLYADRRLP